jgi:N-formylglutamate amidohydrolase
MGKIRKQIGLMAPKPAFTLFNADNPAVPLLLSVPHAGRDYPPELLANLRVPAADLLRLEDRYADRLVQPAISAGIPAIVAHRARAWIDLNRIETDLDPQMLSGAAKNTVTILSAKTRGGLGLIPRRLQSSGELWRRPLEREEVERRIASAHRPFHGAIREILDAMRARFGIAILLDVHSMPPIPLRLGASLPDDAPAQIVVGDRFGRSAASLYAELMMAHVRSAGIEVALNNPYSGDFILQAHGRPSANIHAVQLEVDRSLYLDSALREPSSGLSAAARLVHEIADLLIDQAQGSTYSEAAE